jgi:Tol biopolymer transport system component
MGEVYRARDPRLGRDVAIKVLSPQIAADADALVRFEREARALAALNHPNIAAIYGVEDNGAQPALVLELVDGETLADRIARGPLAPEEAAEFAMQIADALDVAHEAGIVHRDLKPGNIKITDDGRIKVLDFGLAKAVAIAAGESLDLDPANSPTITVHGTKHGVILGTAAYMSPEQARGKRIDKRTDIWAFGCVLFEMLTGKRAFTGETSSDVIAAIIERPADLTLLPAATPPALRQVIRRCVEKDPRRRARDIADVRAELDAAPGRSAQNARRATTGAVAAMAIVTVAALMVAAAAWRRNPAASLTPAPIAFSFGAPQGYRLAPQPGMPSPDARYVAFVAQDEQQVPSVFVRSVDTAGVRHLEGTENVLGAPTWAPDSRSVAFWVNNSWKRIGIDGGPPVTITTNVPGNLGASWGPGDMLLAGPANRTPLSRVQVTGGALREETKLAPQVENSHRWPQLLPDGRHFLFTVRSDQPERLGIKLGTLGTSDARMLVNVASQGVYTAPGMLLFITPDRVVMAQRFDPQSWTLQGTAQAVAGPVVYNGPSFFGGFAASADGKLLTYLAAPRGGATLQWFDRTGAPLEPVTNEREYRGVRLSPDGKLAAVELADEHLGTRDVWLMDIATQALTRLTSHAATDWRPVFSPDGKRLAFASDRAGASTTFVMPTSGGDATALYRPRVGGAYPVDWSSDGKWVLVHVDDEGGRSRLTVMVPVDGGEPSTLIDDDQIFMSSSRISPDGARIASMGFGAGTRQIYVTSIRDRHRLRITPDGGMTPRWGSNGHEVIFINARNELMRVSIEGDSVGKPERLFTACASVNRAYNGGPAEPRFDVTPDGKRFLISCDSVDNNPSAINVIVNWQSRLK